MVCVNEGHAARGEARGARRIVGLCRCVTHSKRGQRSAREHRWSVSMCDTQREARRGEQSLGPRIMYSHHVVCRSHRVLPSCPPRHVVPIKSSHHVIPPCISIMSLRCSEACCSHHVVTTMSFPSCRYHHVVPIMSVPSCLSTMSYAPCHNILSVEVFRSRNNYKIRSRV